MIVLTALAFSTILGPQDNASKQARELVEKLRSDKVEEREEAARKLKALGKDAIPELERVARDSDPEVAGRARYLIDLFQIETTLPENLKKQIPEVLDRLSRSGNVGWREVFLEACQEKDGKRRYPCIVKEDLEYLAPRAVRGAVTVPEKISICDRVSGELLVSAAPEFAKLLGDTDAKVRQHALEAIGRVAAKEASAEVGKLLSDRNEQVRETAAGVLACLEAKEFAPEFVKLLKNETPKVRLLACETLESLEAQDTIPSVTLLLRDPEEEVRLAAAKALCTLGSREGVPLLLDAARKGKGAKLDCLNKLRQPEVWNRLRGQKYTKRYEGNTQAIPDLVSTFTRMKVELSEGAKQSFQPGAGSEISIIAPASLSRSVLGLVQVLVGTKPMGISYNFILERDSIKILRDHEAVRFWTEWWKAEQERPK